jgi:hypothetical protein
MGPGDVVWAAFHRDELQALDQTRQALGGGLVRQDPVRVAVDEQRPDVDSPTPPLTAMQPAP